MADKFDYDELLRLAQLALPVTAVVCRSREEALAFLCWEAEQEELGWPVEDVDG